MPARRSPSLVATCKSNRCIDYERDYVQTNALKELCNACLLPRHPRRLTSWPAKQPSRDKPHEQRPPLPMDTTVRHLPRGLPRRAHAQRKPSALPSFRPHLPPARGAARGAQQHQKNGVFLTFHPPAPSRGGRSSRSSRKTRQRTAPTPSTTPPNLIMSCFRCAEPRADSERYSD